MATPVSGTVDEKDGALVIKDGDKEVRYVRESDLLAVKEGRVTKEDAAKQVSEAKAAATAEATTKIDEAHQKVLRAEARVSSLEEQITKGGGDAAELVKATAALATAKTSSEELGNKFLELKRDVIVRTYNVPKETVAKKTLAALEVYEEALKAVIGNKSIGNFAVGGGGGASVKEVKNASDVLNMAVEAYAQSKK